MTAGLLFYYFIRVAEVTYTNQQRLFVPKTLCESPSQKKKNNTNTRAKLSEIRLRSAHGSLSFFVCEL